MACEGCLFPQVFAAGQKRGIDEMLWENSNPLYNVPLLVLQEVILDTGSVNAFSSLLKDFTLRSSVGTEHERYFVLYIPVPLWMRFVGRSDLYWYN